MKFASGLTAEQRRLADQIGAWRQTDGIPRREIDTVVRLVREVRVPSQWAFISQDTPGDAAYLLLSGRAAVIVNGEPVEVLTPGAVIGEMALVRNRLRSASVVAREPCELLHLSSEAFERMQSECPELTQRWVTYTQERAQSLAHQRTASD
jgi:CRP-like cAMP-binding protein